MYHTLLAISVFFPLKTTEGSFTLMVFLLFSPPPGGAFLHLLLLLIISLLGGFFPLSVFHPFSSLGAFLRSRYFFCVAPYAGIMWTALRKG